MSKARFLFVLGLWRSGTSAMAGALHEGGYCSMGEKWVPYVGHEGGCSYEAVRYAEIVNRRAQSLIPSLRGWPHGSPIAHSDSQVTELLRQFIRGRSPTASAQGVKHPWTGLLLPEVLTACLMEDVEPVFIRMRRPLHTVWKSMTSYGLFPELSPPALMRMLTQLENTTTLCLSGLPCLDVGFDGLLREPLPTIQRVGDFLGWVGDAEAAARTIRPEVSKTPPSEPPR